MTLALDDDFRRYTIDKIFDILTECGSIKAKGETNTNSSFLASREQVYRLFRKFHTPPAIQQDLNPRTKQRFNEYIKGTEFEYYTQTIRELLQIPQVVKAPNAIIQSVRLQDETPQRVLQEWYNENEERVKETHVAIMAIVRTAISVAWDLDHSADIDIETRVQRFLEHDDIQELYESSDNDLFPSILARTEIEAIFRGVIWWKRRGDALESVLFKHILLNEEKVEDLWNLVMGIKEYQPIRRGRHQPHNRQRQALKEVTEPFNCQENENKNAVEDEAISGIQTSACLERICQELLQQNLDSERVCEAALERLVELVEGGYIRIDAIIHAREEVAKPILVSMIEHENNPRIQKCGVLLLWRTEFHLSMFLGRLHCRATFAVSKAIKNFPDKRTIQRRGLELIWSLQDCAKSLDDFYFDLVDFGALDFIRSALVNHQDHYDIVKPAIALLGNILGGNKDETNSSTLNDDDGIADFVCRNPGDIREVVADAYKHQKEQVNEDRARENLKPLVKRARILAKRMIEKTF